MKETKSADKLALNVTDVAAVLGISRPKAYELMRREDFPVVQLGSRKIVPRSKLEEWLEAQADARMEVRI